MPPIERKKVDLGPLHNSKVPILFIIGGPGSGKGTQCQKIKARWGLNHLSSGDLLRAEVQSGSERGKTLSKMMEAGELVPLEVVLDLLKEAMVDRVSKGSVGFLLDGYPRELHQAEQFEKEIMECTLMVYLHVSEKVMTERLMSRGLTSGRVDDNAETIKKRLTTFHDLTIPVVNFYKKKNKVVEVSAEAGIEEVFQAIVPHLDKILKPKA